MLAAVSGLHIPITLSLAVIGFALTIAVLASLLFGKPRREPVLENN
jgi:hypothetical protein